MTKVENQELAALQAKLNSERRSLRTVEADLNKTRLELEVAGGAAVFTSLAAAENSVSRLAVELDYARQQLAEAVTERDRAVGDAAALKAATAKAVDLIRAALPT